MGLFRVGRSLVRQAEYIPILSSEFRPPNLSRYMTSVSSSGPAHRHPVRGLVTTTSTAPDSIQSSIVKESVSSDSAAPTKETLLRIDWLVEHLTPGILKSRLKPFFDICKDDLIFDDRVYKYNLSSRTQLLSHIAKIRMYYRYLSPYNKVEHLGSCVYEGEDVIVLLWRLSTLESNFWSYFPSFLTKKEPKINTMEGALDIHVTKDGLIYKIINRKVTASDREGARVLAKIKETQEAARKKEEDKKMKEELEAHVEDQKRRGLL